jgi:GTPase KRas protein
MSLLSSQWIRTSEGFLLVYSITSKESFEGLVPIHQHIERVKEDSPNPPMVLVGNKADLETSRQVTPAMGTSSQKNKQKRSRRRRERN